MTAAPGQRLRSQLRNRRFVTSRPSGRVLGVATAVAFLAICACSPAFAAPGDLDRSFGSAGYVFTDFGGRGPQAKRVVVQADGKIVAAGDIENSFVLARFGPDGSLDPTFAGDGTQISAPAGRLGSIVLQPDGKVVAVGSVQGSFTAARYMPDGSFDPTFSGDGIQSTKVGGSPGAAEDGALQADGKIVLAGGADGRFALVRYNPDGSLDPTFSGDGIQTTEFSGHGAGATSVTVQPDGKIVAAGRGSTNDIEVARYMPDGSLDMAFSEDGTQSNDFSANDIAFDVAVQGDGKIVVAGYTRAQELTLVRYNVNGSLDTSFSGDGRADAGSRYPVFAVGLVIQPDGKIAVAGNDNRDTVLARFNPDGTLDTSFSGGGKQMITGELGSAGAIALQADGKLVVSGTSGIPGQFGVARYDTTGSRDPSFSGDGKVTAEFPLLPSLDIPNAVAMQPDGKLVVAGDSEQSAALARYGRDGALDPSFSGDGKQTMHVRDDTLSAKALIVQRDGKLVIAARGFAGSRLVRYRTDGSIDASFSGGGTRRLSFAARGLAQQRDGKLIVVGSSRRGFALARYNIDGSLDRSFAGDGKQTMKLLGQAATAVAVRRDGRIVVAGAAAGPKRSDVIVARYRRNGALDRSFSRDGRQTADFGFYDSVESVFALPGGGILVVGSSTAEESEGPQHGPTAIALARFKPNGSLDKGFSGDGKQLTKLYIQFGDTATAIQPDTRIVVAATAVEASGIGFALARYHPDGSLDKSFSRDGKLVSRLGFDWYAAGLAVQPSGRIVVAGRGHPPGPEERVEADFALVGYRGGGGRVAAPRVTRFRFSSLAGSTLRFRLSERARVSMAIERRVRGRLVGGRCRRATPARRGKPRCARNVRVGRLRRSGRAGLNRVAFSGRLGREMLNAGSYRASLKAVDRKGYVSRIKRTKFRIRPR